MLQLVTFGWFSGGSEVCVLSGWVVCVLDTITQLCLRLPRRGALHLLIVGSEFTRRVAVLLLLVGGSGSLGPLLGVSCVASAGPYLWVSVEAPARPGLLVLSRSSNSPEHWEPSRATDHLKSISCQSINISS